MGSGVLPLAMTTRPTKDQMPEDRDQGSEESVFVRDLLPQATRLAHLSSDTCHLTSERGLSLQATSLSHLSSDTCHPTSEIDQADRAISTGWLAHCCAFTSGLST